MGRLSLHGPIGFQGMFPASFIPGHRIRGNASRPKVPPFTPSDLQSFLFTLGSLRELRLWEMVMSKSSFVQFIDAICSGAPSLSSLVLHAFIETIDASLDVASLSRLNNLASLQLEIAFSHATNSLDGLNELLQSISSRLMSLHLKVPPTTIGALLANPVSLSQPTAPRLRELSLDTSQGGHYDEDVPEIETLKVFEHLLDVEFCYFNVANEYPNSFANVRHLVLDDVTFPSTAVISNSPHLCTLTYSGYNDVLVSSCPSLISVKMSSSEEIVTAHFEDCPGLVCVVGFMVYVKLRKSTRVEHVDASELCDFEELLPALRTLIVEQLSPCVVNKCSKLPSLKTLVIGMNGITRRQFRPRYYSPEDVDADVYALPTACFLPSLEHLVMSPSFSDPRIFLIWNLPALKTLYVYFRRDVGSDIPSLHSSLDLFCMALAPNVRDCLIQYEKPEEEEENGAPTQSLPLNIGNAKAHVDFNVRFGTLPPSSANYMPIDHPASNIKRMRMR
eukprot:CAMPEP_0184671534 /NCGR_PEP_ID=MMETSP0308-20130426/85562_1 /TAXON_ID=38269 /ORGANISM="Gloeochaete witrockiana, Strain SAG 46.84" /LENGTH=503 /DNA_ID=CAMNT_0027118687 /DNA_START=705 /DNA_END=2216 /DNA_ORIENTATION=-